MGPNNALLKKRYGPAAAFIIEWKRVRGRFSTPWAVAYNNILSRCTKPRSNGYKYYGGNGVLCLVSSAELREMFIREKAYMLKIPSVDRIDPRGHYEPSNVRWVEFSDNRAMRGIDHPSHRLEMDEARKKIMLVLDGLPWTVGMKGSLLLRINREVRMRAKT